MSTHLRRIVTYLALLGGALLVACGGRGDGRSAQQPPTATAAVSVADDAPSDTTLPTVVVAPSVRVDTALVQAAFQRVLEQGERDYGVRPERTVTIFIDPDSAIGLEDALGLSARYAIHLRAGRVGRMDTLLPLLMHEYTHVLQYQIGRLRPQWWIEGQADYQAQRVADPGRATQTRRTLYRQLGGDVKAGSAPSLAELRGSTGWDEYIKRSGPGKAYGWGQAAVAFIEDGWGFEAVRRIMTDSTGPNTLGSFDEAVRRETGFGPVEFEAGLRAWLVKQT